ncbi:unnamed protein product [Lota lota]
MSQSGQSLQQTPWENNLHASQRDERKGGLSGLLALLRPSQDDPDHRDLVHATDALWAVVALTYESGSSRISPW